MERVPILQLGNALVFSIQVDLQDDSVVALQEDLAARIVATGAAGVVTVEHLDAPMRRGGQELPTADGNLLARGVQGRARRRHRLVRARRRVHRGQIVRAQQPRQLAGIAPIGLDALTRLDRDQRRRHHLADHPAALELAL